MPLFGVFRAFLVGFRVVVWVCIVWVICVACGAFVCVRCLAVLWLAACLPFLLSFRLAFCPFISLPVFRLSSSVCPLVLSCLSCFGFVVAFSLSDVQTKRKGANCCPLRPLLSCCGLCCYLAASGMMKLLQAVSSLSASPAIQATVK